MLIGVDWARIGWLAVGCQEGRWDRWLFASFEELLEATQEARVLVVDVPMGLPKRGTPGGRAADRAARRILPAGRRSTVFPTPSRRALAARDLAEGQRLNAPAGMNRQVFALLPQIREVDRALRPELQTRIWEGHPELSFFAAGGWPAIRHPKRTKPGRLARLEVLKARLGAGWQRWFEELPGRDSLLADLLDACALVWTAARLAEGKAGFAPEEPAFDERGLRMQIVY